MGPCEVGTILLLSLRTFVAYKKGENFLRVFWKRVSGTGFISRSIARSKQNQINRIILNTMLATPTKIGQFVIASVA